jgi:thiol-disulfide isomerase/thioredoxin
MMQRLPLALLVFAVATTGLAERQPGTPAPEFPSKAIWLGNGAPLTMQQLRGKVVIVDFWEYTCINCIRTFPHLKDLYTRYHDAGLEIIGVHKGEFEFAADEKDVAAAYRRFGLPYPTIVDVRDAVWRAYDCRAWPDAFVVDRSGIIRGVHQGEGGYGALEGLVQRLLKEGHPELNFSSFSIPKDMEIFAPSCGPMSDELMIGTKWGPATRIANIEGFEPGRAVDYKATSKRVHNGFFVEGSWKNQPDDFESAENPKPGRSVSLGISYQGREVYAVLDRGSKEPVEVVVTRDGAPVPEPLRGRDIKARPDGQTVLIIDEPRMYYVIQGEDDGTHELVFSPTKKGARICSFTFGNHCLENFDKL